MIARIKRMLYRSLSLESYLRLLQRSYFFMYRTGMLKGKPEYAHHYFVRKLIKKGDTVIDIGANLGYYSILFSDWVGKGGRVYSVEPIELYNKVFMKKARRRRNITLIPYALGDEEKEVALVTSPQSGYLNTGLPHVYDPKRDGGMEQQEFAFRAQMRVPSRLFADIGKIDYVKCDIEGFEWFVLSDMKELIRQHRPIVQVEIWDDNLESLTAMFSSLGYTANRLVDKRLLPAAEHPEAFGDYIFTP